MLGELNTVIYRFINFSCWYDCYFQLHSVCNFSFSNKIIISLMSVNIPSQWRHALIIVNLRHFFMVNGRIIFI